MNINSGENPDSQDVIQWRSVLPMVLPHEFRQEAMKGVHDDCGHLGQDRAIDLLRAQFYWPLISADMKKYICTCKRCTQRKDEAGLKTHAPMLSTETSQPLELVCMDFLSLEECKGGIKDLLVITDQFLEVCCSDTDTQPDS
ncbi:uncharacterized protein [Ptychodera flava]|uniref:uncharacterized protein n=1 Tax=Ptychodera flava TaxID=63121 RepID=UPI00396A7221